MPVDGIPDNQIHRLCVRCGKWCWPQEGVDHVLPPVRPAAVEIARAVAGIDESVRFICHGCVRARRRLRYAVFGTLGLLVVLAVALKRLGIV